MGFTSALGAAAAKPRLDVVLRNAINAGEFPGPRYLAGSQEITTLGGLGDNTLPHLPFRELNFGEVVSGPEEVRRAARMFIKYGVDHLKINLSGEYIAGIPAEASPFSEEEIAMLAAEAKRAGKRVAAHARSRESVKQCVRHGLELVFHASFADEEALDMLEANKDRHFVAPGIGWLVSTLYHADKWGITEEVATKMGYARGIRILPGGDYGFAWMPHGTNSRDLEHFVKYIGMTPKEALLSATSPGGELMMQPDSIGKIAEGYYADIVFVDGDPLKNLKVLQDPTKISLVMKDGEIIKSCHDVTVPEGPIHVTGGNEPVRDEGVKKAMHAEIPLKSRRDMHSSPGSFPQKSKASSPRHAAEKFTVTAKEPFHDSGKRTSCTMTHTPMSSRAYSSNALRVSAKRRFRRRWKMRSPNHRPKPSAKSKHQSTDSTPGR
jgi:imidazolonepropionase-like amidohydrolase